MRHPKKPKYPGASRYRELEAELMRQWCPDVYPCAWCGYPVMSGYCCTHCGSATPDLDEPPKGRE